MLRSVGMRHFRNSQTRFKTITPSLHHSSIDGVMPSTRKPRTKNQEPRTKNQEPRTKNSTLPIHSSVPARRTTRLLKQAKTKTPRRLRAGYRRCNPRFTAIPSHRRPGRPVRPALPSYHVPWKNVHSIRPPLGLIRLDSIRHSWLSFRRSEAAAYGTNGGRRTGEPASLGANERPERLSLRRNQFTCELCAFLRPLPFFLPI